MTTLPTVPELSVVYPAFNEERSIGSLVRAAVHYLQRARIAFEIAVVDDGSRDGTRDVLHALSGSDPRIRVLTHDRNLGYGAAIRSGLSAARGRRVLISDGDGQFEINQLASLWSRRGEADVVLGFRNPRNDPPARRLAGWLYGRVIVPLALGVRVRDVNCGFKLLDRRVLERIDLASTGALISAELIARARLAGATFVEVGVDHEPRRAGRPTGLLPRVVLRTMVELASLRPTILGRSAWAVGEGLGGRLRYRMRTGARDTRTKSMREVTRAGLRARCDTVESRPS